MALGRTGVFCPCVLFGRNVEALREDIPWTTPCVCHAVFVEGGITLAILTAIFHGVDPRTSFLIGEGLVFSWWLCATYTGIFRQELQRKYHLKVQFVDCFRCYSVLMFYLASFGIPFYLADICCYVCSRTLRATHAWYIAAYTGVQTARSIARGAAVLRRTVLCP